MATLYDILAQAQNGEAMRRIGREYSLNQEQTQAAVASLLPAISLGLKRSTDTPEGLGELLSLMGRQPGLYEMFDDPDAPFSRAGQLAGEVAVANMFGSPEAPRAIADRAQQASGIGSGILEKLLSALAGILLSAPRLPIRGRARAPETRRPSRSRDGDLCRCATPFMEKAVTSKLNFRSRGGLVGSQVLFEVLEEQQRE